MIAPAPARPCPRRAAALALVAAVALDAEAARASVWDRIGGRDDGAHSATIQAAVQHADVDEAVRRLDAAASASPGDEKIVLWALQRLTLAQRYDDVLGRTADITTDEDAASSPGRAFFRAFALAHRGDYADAARLLEVATRYRTDLTDRPRYLANLAELLVAAGQPQRAAFYYRQASTSPPVGLAAALWLAGDHEAARTVARDVALADPTLAQLSEPGAVFVPPGIDLLYLAIVADAVGQADVARAQFAAFAASPAGHLAPADGVANAAAGVPQGSGAAPRHASFVPIDSCTVLAAALRPDRGELAVRCEQSGLRVRSLAPAADTYGVPDDRLNPWNADPYLVDVAYAPDGATLRVLYLDGAVAEIASARPDLVYAPRTDRAQPEIAGHRFVTGAAGQRVVLTGQTTVGYQVEPWDAHGAPLQLNPLGAFGWVGDVQIAASETVVAVSDRVTVSVVGASGQRPVSIAVPVSGSRFQSWALSPDGRTIALARSRQVSLHDAATAQVSEIIPMLDAAELDPAFDAYTGISALRWADERTLLVGTSAGVWVVEQ